MNIMVTGESLATLLTTWGHPYVYYGYRGGFDHLAGHLGDILMYIMVTVESLVTLLATLGTSLCILWLQGSPWSPCWPPWGHPYLYYGYRGVLGPLAGHMGTPLYMLWLQGSHWPTCWPHGDTLMYIIVTGESLANLLATLGTS